MKFKSIILAAGAAAVLVSCGQVNEVTEISGTVVPDGISEVNVIVGELVDTLVPVLDGKFSVTVPADVTVLGTVSAANYGANFISDGTPLEIVLDVETEVISKYPRVSVQDRFNRYNAEEEVLMDEYKAAQERIYTDSLSTDEQKREKFEEFFDEFEDRYYGHHKQACVDNKDNFIAVFALSNLRGQIDDEDIVELVDMLIPVLQENEYVKGIKEALIARLETSEGKMFKDFTVNSVVGQTRSVPPQPKYAEVKLSDYVGKGKYILLDFWSPWCGPCRREMPNIKAVYDKYKGENFDVVSIAVWERQPVEVTIETAAKLEMTWNQINNGQREPAALYGVEGIPHLILFGPDGTILKRGFHGAEIEEVVSSYLK